MYSLSGYGKMITDELRMAAYVEAMQQVIKPGMVVLDIGTGSGIIAMLACQFGASRVYAIEPDPIIQLARQLAVDNGYADKIDFFEGLSTELNLPQPADVMISDLRGVLPLFQSHLPSVIDARTRLLKPGGHQIPQLDRIYATVVEDPELYQKFRGPWDTNPYGLKLQSGLHYAVNTWGKTQVTPEQYIVEPQLCAELNYLTLETFDFKAELHWKATKNGVAHGYFLWFNSVLRPGVEMVNTPGQPELIYGGAFFPWAEPINLAVGDIITANLKANLVGEGEQEYVWRWNTLVQSGDGTQPVKAKFQQSTFQGSLLSTNQLRRKQKARLQ